MTYGVTPDGFTRKTLQEIKAEFESSYKSILSDGENDVRIDPQSGVGQTIGIQSDQISLLWEVVESVYYSQYPATAEDASLDNVLNLNGLSRLSAEPSLVPMVLTRTDESQDVIISSLPEFQVLSNDGTLFKIQSDNTLYDLREAETAGNTFEIYGVYVECAVDSGTYFLTFNGVEVSYTSVMGDSLDDILQGILDSINNEEINGVVAELVPRTPIPVGSETGTKTLYVRATGRSFNFGQYSGSSTLNLYQSIVFQSLDNAVEDVVQSENFGVVQTPRAGIQSLVKVFSDGQIGRDVETDADARLRRYESLQVLGGATIDAIRSRILQQVEGVFAATVLENDTLSPIPVNLPVPFDNFPPKSIWCIVDGGNDEEIANKIFETKSAGIQPFGDIGAFEVIDDQGIGHDVWFSRSTNVSIYIDVKLTLSQEEEAPSDVVELVKENVVDYINGLSIAEDVIYQKIFTPVYVVGGISEVELLISKTSPASGIVNIPIDFNEKARTDDAKVSVSIS